MSSMLVNGHILIDCGPTVLDVMNCYDVDPAGITDILLTHTHSDHLHPGNIMSHRQWKGCQSWTFEVLGRPGSTEKSARLRSH